MASTSVKIQEHTSQVQFIQWCKRQGFYCSHEEFNPQKQYIGIVHSTPNAGERSVETVRYFKEEGMLTGVADVSVKLPSVTVEFEFKTETGKQSPKQKDYEIVCNQVGIPYYVVRNTFEAVKIMKGYIK